MNDTEIFTCPQILSVLTGSIINFDIIGASLILDFITGDKVPFSRLSAAAKFGRDVIISQHPDLSEVDETFELQGEFFVTARPDLWLVENSSFKL